MNRRLGSLVASFAFGAALWLGWGARAQADEWKEIPVGLDAAQAKLAMTKVSAIIRQGGAPNAADAKQLDDFFKKYYFPAMTGASGESLANLADMRINLFRRYINATGSAATRDYLVKQTLAVMSSIAKGPYHPAVRYNAVTILGQLDKEPAKANGLPVPLAEGAAELLTLLETEEIKGTKIPTSLKVGALVGIERHARLGADAKLAPRMTAAALAVAGDQQPPEDATVAVHDWMRGQAVRVLVQLHAKGATAPVLNAIAALLADEKISLDQRCRMAETLTTAMFAATKGVDLEPLIAAYGKLAKDVLADEKKTANKYLDDLVNDPNAASAMGPGGGGFGGGGFGGRGGEFGGGGMGMPMEEVGPRYEKRRMLQRVMALAAAADALKAGDASAETKQRLDQVRAGLMPVADLAVKKNTTVSQLVEEVVKMAEAVTAQVEGWGGAAKDDAVAAAAK